MRTERPVLRAQRRQDAGAGRRGFTLVELLVVMVIVAIAFFALRPGIVSVRRGAENRTAIRQLVGLLTSARTEAVAGGRLVRVMCGPSADAFWAEVQVDPAADRGEFGLLRVLGREQVRLPHGLLLGEVLVAGQSVADPAQNPIYFYPDGRTDGATMLLLDANGREVVVHVAPATGRVSVSA